MLAEQKSRSKGVAFHCSTYSVLVLIWTLLRSQFIYRRRIVDDLHLLLFVRLGQSGNTECRVVYTL